MGGEVRGRLPTEGNSFLDLHFVGDHALEYSTIDCDAAAGLVVFRRRTLE